MISYETFNRFKNATSNACKNAKKKYFSEKFENCKGDPGRSWKTTKNLLGWNKEAQLNIVLENDGNRFEYPLHVCKIFNRYFVEVGEKLAENISSSATSPYSYLGPSNEN